MPRSTGRVLELLELLEAGGLRTAPALAERLGVDERTVRRYLDHLGELGIPVDAVRGRHGGYRLGRGYRLPPLMFTDDEALAVMVGLATAGRSGLLDPDGSAPQRAQDKIRRVLPVRLARRLATLADAVDALPARPVDPPPTTASLLRCADAVRELRVLAFAYADRRGRTSRRRLQPYGIAARGGHWYVSGRDVDRRALRNFRIDRMTLASVTAERFDPPDGFDPASAVRDALVRAPWRHQVVLRVQADLRTVEERLPAGIAAVDADGDGWTRVELQVERLDWLPALVARLRAPVVVDGPPQLRTLLAESAQLLMAAATDQAGLGAP